jgi:hypothetical protein
MNIGIPTLYVTECRHIKVTKDAGTESVQIDFDNGVFVVLATGKPELENCRGKRSRRVDHDCSVCRDKSAADTATGSLREERTNRNSPFALSLEDIGLDTIPFLASEQTFSMLLIKPRDRGVIVDLLTGRCCSGTPRSTSAGGLAALLTKSIEDCFDARGIPGLNCLVEQLLPNTAGQGIDSKQPSVPVGIAVNLPIVRHQLRDTLVEHAPPVARDLRSQIGVVVLQLLQMRLDASPCGRPRQADRCHSYCNRLDGDSLAWLNVLFQKNMKTLPCLALPSLAPPCLAMPGRAQPGLAV